MADSLRSRKETCLLTGMVWRGSILTLCALFTLFCQGETREWKSTVGTSLRAEFIHASYETVSLRREDGTPLKVKWELLSLEDQIYLESKMSETHPAQINGLALTPGKISERIPCLKKKQWGYSVYLPKRFHLARTWPVLFVMSPGGGSKGNPLNRYTLAAEKLGCLLVLSYESKNKFRQSQEAVETMVEDVYKRFPVEKGLAFSSGMSGGSRMAFLLAEFQAEVVGVLACGSGLGIYPDKEPFRKAVLPSKTKVYSLVGTNCFNRTGVFETHHQLPKENRLRYFLGNHDWADKELLYEGLLTLMAQVLEEREDLTSQRIMLLSSLNELIEKKKEKEPWEALYLAKLAVPLGLQAHAETIQKLEEHPQVLNAVEADADLTRFAEKYYLKYDYFNGDREDLPARTKFANQLSEKYPDLPHRDIFRRLGMPCK